MEVEDFEQKSAGLTHSLGNDALIRLRGKKATSIPDGAKLPKKNEAERFAVVNVCRTPPSNEHIGRPMDVAKMQHQVRKIATVDRNVEEDEERCCCAMERNVQTPFKPMYEVYMRRLLEASSQYSSQGHMYAPSLFMM